MKKLKLWEFKWLDYSHEMHQKFKQSEPSSVLHISPNVWSELNIVKLLTQYSTRHFIEEKRKWMHIMHILKKYEIYSESFSDEHQIIALQKHYVQLSIFRLVWDYSIIFWQKLNFKLGIEIMLLDLDAFMFQKFSLLLFTYFKNHCQLILPISCNIIA